MAVTSAKLSVPRKSLFGYRLLNEASWINLAKVIKNCFTSRNKEAMGARLEPRLNGISYLQALVAEYVMTAAFIFLSTGMVVSGCNSTGNTSTSVAGSSATSEIQTATSPSIRSYVSLDLLAGW